MMLTLGSVDSATDGTELAATEGRVEGAIVGLVETGAIVGLVETGATVGLPVETGAIVGLAGCWVGIATGDSTCEICVVIATEGLSVVTVMTPLVSSSSSTPT